MNEDIRLISRKLQERHGKFINKYGAEVSRELSDEILLRDRLYSKIILVAKAFERAGIADHIEEVSVRASRAFYDRSVVIITGIGLPLYLLNGGDHCVVTDRIITEDPLSRNLSLCLDKDEDSVYTEYLNVLDEDFDWLTFSVETLDSIHKVAFRSSAAMRKFVLKAMGDENGAI